MRIFYILLFLLTSCSLYSNPSVPENKFRSWAETVADEKAKIDQKWWENFEDPILSELISKAKEHNKDLKIAQAKILQYRAQEQSVIAKNLPLINANGDAARAKSSTTLSNRPIVSKFSNNFNTEFDASWELDVLGIEPAVRASSQLTQTNLEAYNNTLVTLYGELASSYFKVRKLQEQSRILKASAYNSQVKLNSLKSLEAAGKISKAEVLKYETENYTIASRSRTAEDLLIQETYYLENLIGVEPNSLKEILAKPYKTFVPSHKIVASIPSVVLANRPDVRMAEKEYLYNTSLQDVAVTQLFPHISIAGILGYESGRESLLFNSRSKVFSIAGGLTVPIFDWKKIKADMAEADAGALEALAKYEKSVLGALSDVESSFAGYKAANDNFLFAEQSYKSGFASKILSDDKLKAGKISNIENMEEKSALFENEINLAEARFAKLNQMVRVYKSLGGGWEN